jgi:deoxyadenosine/deoxycytidine kinase
MSAVQDRSVYEDAEIFARNLHRQGRMSDRDYRTYRELYDAMNLFLPPPDLIVYLRASVSTLLQRIAARGRPYERAIEPAYLEQLNELYEEWAATFDLCPMLTVPADDLDFVMYNADLEFIVDKIIDRLQGKETVVFDSWD